MTWRQCMASKKSKNGGITIKTQNDKTGVTRRKNCITRMIFYNGDTVFRYGNTKVYNEISALIFQYVCILKIQYVQRFPFRKKSFLVLRARQASFNQNFPKF